MGMASSSYSDLRWASHLDSESDDCNGEMFSLCFQTETLVSCTGTRTSIISSSGSRPSNLNDCGKDGCYLAEFESSEAHLRS